MTLDQIEMVEAVVVAGSYQAAAKKLGKSQPSLSVGIKKIEELYQIELFSRAGYRPVLTEQGKRFFQSAKTTLRSYRNLHQVAQQLSAGTEPYLNISVDPIVLSHRFDWIFDILMEQNYQTSLSIRSGILQKNRVSLLEGKADFAIGHNDDLESSEIVSQYLCTIELIPVIHRRHCLNGIVDPHILENIPNLIVRSGPSDRSNFSGRFPFQWEVDSHARKTEMISCGHGWGKLSSVQLKMYPELVVIPQKVVSSLELSIHFMRLRDKPMGPVAQKIWQACISRTHSD